MAVFADPLELLGAMNPVPTSAPCRPPVPTCPPSAPCSGSSPRASRWPPRRRPPGRRRLRTAAKAAGHRRRPSKRLLVGVAVATVALVAAAAAWVVTRPADDPTRVACFAAADLEADTAPLAAGLGDPVAACEEVWRTGPFQAWGAVPPLAACVLTSGVHRRLPRRAVGVRPARPCPTCHGEWRLECSGHPVGGWPHGRAGVPELRRRRSRRRSGPSAARSAGPRRAGP